MRRRVHYASWVVAACSALWLGVVCSYSIGRDREQKKQRKRIEVLEKSVSKIPSLLSSATNSLASSLSLKFSSYSLAQQNFNGGFGGEAPEKIFEPRFIGAGQTRSKSAVYLYEDWEVEEGVTQRRFVARFPLSQLCESSQN